MSPPAFDEVALADFARSKLRIAVFNRTFSPTGGGAERYSIALVEQLAERHEIHVFAQQINHDWPGVSYHRVSAPLVRPRWLNQLWFATATWWATRRGYDVVHSHENTWHGDVQTLHVLPVKYNLFHALHGWRRILRWIKVLTSPRLLTYLFLERARCAARSSRRVVATSESLRAIIATSYPAIAPILTVITPGVTMPKEHTTPARRQAARLSLGLPLDGYCLLFVGNDYRKKGLATLVMALAQLPVEVMLAVVGNPVHIPAFRAQIAALQLDTRVFFLGSLPDMAPAYEAADSLVHPTLEDTFAMVVLEAMSYGLPVVVSDARYCGIAGLLTNGVNARILLSPNDATELSGHIRQIFQAPLVYQALAMGSRIFATHWSWAAIAEQQDRIYRKIAGYSGRNGPCITPDTNHLL